jgi:hypothetical protein
LTSFLGGSVGPGVAEITSIVAAMLFGRVAVTGVVIGSVGLGAVGGFMVGTLAQEEPECGCK